MPFKVCPFKNSNIPLTGEVADLLGVKKQDVAFNIIPAALAKLTEGEDTAALESLALNAGMQLNDLMSDFGDHAIAKFLYEGKHSPCSYPYSLYLLPKNFDANYSFCCLCLYKGRLSARIAMLEAATVQN